MLVPALRVAKLIQRKQASIDIPVVVSGTKPGADLMKPSTLLALLLVAVCTEFFPASAGAAGAVEMQVERIVTTAIDEYNLAMEEGSPEAWLKYFTDNVRRSSPL